MSATIDLLQRYKEFKGLASDYAAAKALEISQTAISKWRAGATMDETTTLQIAQELKIDPLAALAQVRLERPTTARERRVWERHCARVLLAAVGTACLAVSVPQQAQGSLVDATTYTLCALVLLAIALRRRARRGPPLTKSGPLPLGGLRASLRSTPQPPGRGPQERAARGDRVRQQPSRCVRAVRLLLVYAQDSFRRECLSRVRCAGKCAPLTDTDPSLRSVSFAATA